MSCDYSHIVVAIDLTEQSNHVIEQAVPIAERTGATLSLVHNLEPISYAYGGDLPVEVDTLQDELEKHAKSRLEAVAASFSIPEQHQHILVGEADTSIADFAKREHADLIVVGSHGRTGLAVLLGSTSSTLMKNVTCDVLAVRVAPQEEEPVD